MSYICYRCNLSFNDKSIASIHDDITNHSAQEIRNEVVNQ